LRIELFSRKQAPVIGLDVGVSAIRMVELGRTKTGLRLERFATVPLEAGIFLDGAVAKPEELTEAIERCHGLLRSKTKAVVMGLPLEATFIKRLTIGSELTEEETEEEVANQVSALMLIDPSEISIDFQPMAPAAPVVVAGEDGEEVPAPAAPVDSSVQEVLAMAAKRSKIDELLVPIESAGLRVTVIDSQTLAMHTALDEILSAKGQEIADTNQALVEFGPQTTRLVVLRNGEVIYTRDAMFGLAQLVSDTIMRFGVSEESAHQIIAGEIPTPDGFEDVVRTHVETATQEVQRAMQLFMTSTSFVSVDAIFLHEEGCQLEGLAESIEKVLNTPCAILNPLEGLEIAPAASGATAQAHCLLVACGLAYRRFDL
jgi:type IV pilus assembly protein PilM